MLWMPAGNQDNELFEYEFYKFVMTGSAGGGACEFFFIR
jgi:hypothetical protein